MGKYLWLQCKGAERTSSQWRKPKYLVVHPSNKHGLRHSPLSRWALSGCFYFLYLIVFGTYVNDMALSSVSVSIVYVYVFFVVVCICYCYVFVMIGCIWISSKSQLNFKRFQLPTQWANNRNLAFFTSSWQVVNMMMMIMMLMMRMMMLTIVIV